MPDEYGPAVLRGFDAVIADLQQYTPMYNLLGEPADEPADSSGDENGEPPGEEP